MLRINATPKTRAELEAITNPQSARQPESIPWVYFDTQTIANGGAGPIAFFSNVQADKTLSNLEQAGTIPDPFYFEIEAFNLDYLAEPTTGVAPAGAFDDLASLLYTSRATFVFTFADKQYLRIPATYLHSSGGPVGLFAGSTTADTLTSYAQNGIPDGGFYVGKKIVLPPKQSFQMSIQLGAAAVLAATRTLRLSMAGVLHRRVL